MTDTDTDTDLDAYVKAALQGILAGSQFRLGDGAVSFPDPALVADLALAYAKKTHFAMYKYKNPPGADGQRAFVRARG